MISQDINLAASLLSLLLTLHPGPTARETEWSAFLAREMGLNPAVCCEQRMPDGSRCDILDGSYAYEVEWASKWKEAPAQATLYGLGFNREPAVILLLRSDDDEDEYLRCLAVCARYRIPCVGVRADRYDRSRFLRRLPR